MLSGDLPITSHTDSAADSEREALKSQLAKGSAELEAAMRGRADEALKATKDLSALEARLTAERAAALADAAAKHEAERRSASRAAEDELNRVASSALVEAGAC